MLATVAAAARALPWNGPSVTGRGPGSRGGHPDRFSQHDDAGPGDRWRSACRGTGTFVKHRFMIGASADRSRSNYELLRLLGLIDARHRVRSAPEDIDPIYRAAQTPIVGNRFEGTSRTNGVYFNETLSPLLEPSSDARRALQRHRCGERAVHPRPQRLRTAGSNSGIATSWRRCMSSAPHPIPRRVLPRPLGAVRPQQECGESVRTSDHFTFGPSTRQLGVNWLPIPSLNLFANGSRARACLPSVVELGCAFDPHPRCRCSWAACR